jgi:hypothetical protein
MRYHQPLRQSGVFVAILCLTLSQGRGVDRSKMTTDGDIPDINGHWDNRNPDGEEDQFLCVHINLDNPTEGQGHRDIPEAACHWASSHCNESLGQQCYGSVYSNGSVFIYLDGGYNTLNLAYNGGSKLEGDWHHSPNGRENHAELLRQADGPPNY